MSLKQRPPPSTTKRLMLVAGGRCSTAPFAGASCPIEKFIKTASRTTGVAEARG